MKKDWKVNKLGDVLECLKNGINCKQSKNGNGDKITRIETIAHRKIDFSKVGFCELSDEEKVKYKMERGDILFSHINSPPHVGKTAIFNTNEELYHGVNLLLMRPKNIMFQTYLDYFLKYLHQTGYWKKVCKQSVNQASVNQQDIKKVLIKYPSSITEQQRIVTLIDKYFEAIDKAKENTEKNLQNAREIFESYLQSVFANPGEDWEEKKVSDICLVIAGQSPESKYYNKDGKGLPFYQGKKEFTDEYIGRPTTWTTKVTKEAKKDDILMSVRAPVGPVNFSTEDICIGRGLAAIRTYENIDKKYLFNFLKKNERDIVGNIGAVFNSINKTQIGDTIIPLPPLLEQKKIVDKIDALFTETKTLKSIYQQKLTNLDELKKSILKKAFDGEL